MSVAILTDTTKCIGCRECVAACKTTYDLAPDRPRRWQSDDGLSAQNWTSIIERPGGEFVRKHCRHCLEPACASVCPVGALHHTENGAVVYDKDKCMGCRYCMMACPYGIPRYDWDKPVPYVKKCILCAPRLAEGKLPSCVEVCPTNATIFGRREDMLAEAHKRLKDHPDKYIQHVWGEEEVGGTSVLYISDIDLSFLSYGRKLGPKPLPSMTEGAMKSVPPTFLGMGALMVGLHLFTKRKNRIAKDKADTGEMKDGSGQDG